jgi:hypothetical protein
LPKNLKLLAIFGELFRQPVNHLPNSLESLTIKSSFFTDDLDNLPNQLKVLSIKSDVFDHLIDKLPDSIQSLFMEVYDFRQPIYKLPNQLQSLTLNSGSEYDFTDVMNILPKTVTSVIFNKIDFLFIYIIIILFELMESNLNLDVIARILGYLNKNDSFGFLDTTKLMEPLRKILYGKYVFNHDKINNEGIRQYVKKLKLSSYCNIKMYNMIKSLTIREYTYKFDFSLFPKTLRKLGIWDKWFDNPVDNLPENLKSLKIFSDSFNKPLNHLPNQLKELWIKSQKFNHYRIA